jgi:hypothetical protein
MQVEKCTKPRDVVLYIVNEFISMVRGTDPKGVSGLGKIVLPTLEALRDVTEEAEENTISWGSVVSAVAVIINAYVIAAMYDNAARTCLEALVDWLRASRGTPLEQYSKAIARRLGLPVEI